MKSKLLKFIGIFVLVAVLVAVPCVAFADEPEENVLVTSNGNEVIDNDYFKADETLNLSNITIEGNAFFAGKDVTISDIKVEGSIAVAGQNVNLENVEVTGDIFVAGQYVSVEKTTAKNIYGAGQDFKLSRQSVVNRDAYLAGATVLLDSEADRVAVGTGKLKVGSQAVVRELKGELDEAADIDEEAQIENNTLKVIEISEEVETVEKISVFTIILDAVKKLLRAIILALVVAYALLKVNKIEKIKKYDGNAILMNGVIGFGITALGLIVAAILTFISFTTPIGITLICLYIIAMVLSTAMGVVVIATKVLQDKEANTKNVLLYTLIASVVVTLVKFIPFVGGIVGFIVSMVGVGTLYNVICGKEKETPLNPTEQTETVQ